VRHAPCRGKGRAACPAADRDVKQQELKDEWWKSSARILWEVQEMARSQSRLWIVVTIALSVIVVAAGYPAFQRKFGFPASLIWTAAVVAGVWLTYLIRAWAFSSKGDEPKGE
jgi:hypothetical protein